jgi:pimeloyl-[acyl-carrier protein] methyl ester esterase
MPLLYHEKTGNGPPLALLHGWGWSSEIWQPLVPQLSEYYQLVLIDLPGFGKSPLTFDEYSYENIVLQLLEIVPEKTTWLGWSLGGMIAYWIALHHPERVEKLITVAATPRFLEDDNWPGMASTTLEKFGVQLNTDYEKTVIDFLQLQLRGTQNYDALFLELKTKLLAHKPALSALKGGLELLQTTDFRKELHEIKCDSLHILGRLDRLVPAKVASVLPDYLPQARCEIIPHSGHLPFLSQQDLFMESMKLFV